MNFLQVGLLLGFSALCTSTTDLNIHQLQMVADHLDRDECRKLSEALHQEDIELPKPPTGVKEPNVSCILLLLKWDRTEGAGKTFNDLVFRLRQIGRPDIADRLSKAVYHEKSETLKRLFLDNPAKKLVPKGSFLLDEEPKKVTAMTPVNDEEDTNLSGWQIVSLVSGSLCILLMLVLSCYYYCGSLLASMCLQHAPPTCLEWWGLVKANCRHCVRVARNPKPKPVTGERRQKADKLMAEFNKSLNNYRHYLQSERARLDSIKTGC